MNHDDLNNVALKEQEANMKYEHTINVCVAASCLSSHADQVKTALDEEVKKRGKENWLRLLGQFRRGVAPTATRRVLGRGLT